MPKLINRSPKKIVINIDSKESLRIPAFSEIQVSSSQALAPELVSMIAAGVVEIEDAQEISPAPQAFEEFQAKKLAKEPKENK